MKKEIARLYKMLRAANVKCTASKAISAARDMYQFNAYMSTYNSEWS